MWVRPKSTIREIIQYNNRFGFIGLCFLSGLVQGVHFSQAYSLGAFLSLWVILALIVILAVPIGAISISLTSILLYWTSRLIRGKGSYHDIRAAVSWSNVTAIVSVISIGLMVLTFGEIFFYRKFAESLFGDWRSALLVSFLIVELVLSVWKFVIFILGLAEAQGFSAWMALLNVVFVAIVYLVLFFLLDKILALVGGSNIGLL